MIGSYKPRLWPVQKNRREKLLGANFDAEIPGRLSGKLGCCFRSVSAKQLALLFELFDDCDDEARREIAGTADRIAQELGERERPPTIAHRPFQDFVGCVDAPARELLKLDPRETGTSTLDRDVADETRQ